MIQNGAAAPELTTWIGNSQVQTQRAEAGGRLDDVGRDAEEHEGRVAADPVVARVLGKAHDAEQQHENRSSAQRGFQR